MKILKFIKNKVVRVREYLKFGSLLRRPLLGLYPVSVMGPIPKLLSGFESGRGL